MDNENLISKLQEMIQSSLLKLVDRICLQLVGTSKQLIADKHSDTGNLAKSIDYEIVSQKAFEIVAKILANTEYAQYIHEGTGPAAGHNRYYPNLGAIIQWVGRKGLYERFNRAGNLTKIKWTPGKKFTRQRRKDYWEIENIARAIAWKIYQFGITGFKFFDLAIQKDDQYIKNLIADFNVK